MSFQPWTASNAMNEGRAKEDERWKKGRTVYLVLDSTSQKTGVSRVLAPVARTIESNPDLPFLHRVCELVWGIQKEELSLFMSTNML